MAFSHIGDPLAAVLATTSILKKLEDLGYSVRLSSSLADFNSCKVETRGKPVTPFYSEKLSGLSQDRFLWMQIISRDGHVSGLQGYRYDFVDTSLRDWAPTYIIGLYMQNGEVFVPSVTAVEKPTLANRLRGKLVYHGEFWISPKVRNWKVSELFSRLGMVLSFIKWCPDAVWALSDKDMATRGHPGRMGFSYLESGFLRWQWTSEDNPQIEWLHVAERHAIEQLVSEINLQKKEEGENLSLPAKMQELLSVAAE
jgi:hypothetical protein